MFKVLLPGGFCSCNRKCLMWPRASSRDWIMSIGYFCRLVEIFIVCHSTQGGCGGVKGSSRTLKRFRDSRSPPWPTWSPWTIVQAVHRVQLCSLSSCNRLLDDPAICLCYLDMAGSLSIVCPLDGGVFNASSCDFQYQLHADLTCTFSVPTSCTLYIYVILYFCRSF